MRALVIPLVILFAGSIAGAQPLPFGPQQQTPSVPSPIALPVPIAQETPADAPAEVNPTEGSTTEATKHNTLFAIKVIGGLMVLSSRSFGA